MTIQELANRYYKMFIRDTRDDGTEYVKTTDERPEELTELIHKAHGDMMPDDWKYKFVRRSHRSNCRNRRRGRSLIAQN